WAYALRLAGWPDEWPVWTGSCPCQPYSSAGARKGDDDPRALWWAWRWLIDQCRPPVIFGEQVASKAGRVWLARVRADLEGLGYAVGAADLCAAGVGAPHIRQRLYWVAHPAGAGRHERRTGKALRRGAPEPERLCAIGGLADCDGERLAGRPEHDERAQQPELAASRRDDVVRRGNVGGVAHADGGDASAERQQRSGQQRQQPEDGRALRMGHADDTGPQGRIQRGHSGNERAPWAASVVLPCTDGKARRIEPSAFPLAHGIPGRVGLLRGYGNAIVPQVAAEFIAA